ncbi:MAG: zinc dependent phospholipase C family protein [Acidobacteria bacterium]|nr:zinc dependent phospholipase C family protein [Acidobacteriota bacterium]
MPRLLALSAVCLVTVPLRAYSVLTHEQVVDLAWKDQIQPILLKRYPNTTAEQLKRAHAFAYGGSLVQDMGYYPFGKKFFSDLLHYVRSGDFVSTLLRESSDVDEYAFALGALAHYCADNMGHPTINRVVALEFPKLEARYGHEVTYADNHKAHIRTEFGFDMVQVAKNRYTSDRYHDFIGFEVAKPLLERSFLKTYGISLKDTLGDEDLAIGTFRRAVSNFIPAMTRVALLNRRADLVPETPNRSEKKFLYRVSRGNYEKEWGKGYRRPGLGSRILAFLLRKIPKVGPATALDFKVPNKQTEDMYIRSVDATTDKYQTLLRQAERGELNLPNTDCDTGRPATATEYSLADETYARLLDELEKGKFSQVTPELRSNILAFYSNVKAPMVTKKKQKPWSETEHELEELKNSPGQEAVSSPAT